MHNEVVGGGGYIGFTPSVRPSCIPCPLCSAYSSGLDQFHIYTSYQATSEGVSCVEFFFAKFKIWIFGNFLKLVTLICLVLTWDLMRITSMGNHGAAGGISERRHSSCSSYFCMFLWYWCYCSPLGLLSIEAIRVQLTYCGLVTPHGIADLGQHSSGNCMLPIRC